MHLKHINWLAKWTLHEDPSGSTKTQLTAANVKTKPSHVNLGGGCLYVPDSDLSEFYAKYLRYILIGKNVINLTEQPLVCEDTNAYSPVIIDIDLRYDNMEATQNKNRTIQIRTMKRKQHMEKPDKAIVSFKDQKSL